MKYFIKFFQLIVLSILLSAHMGNLAQAGMIATKDKHGSKDHPLVSRYPGSLIYGYNISDFDEYQFVTGVLKKNKLPTQTVEGKNTTIVYTLPDTLSSFQVFKNYEQAFKKAGVKQVLSCNQSTCGAYLPKKFLNAQGGGNTKAVRYTGVDVYNTSPTKSDYRFWTGILNRNNSKTYITFMVSKNSVGVACLLDIVEPKALETDLVKLDLNSMDAALKSQGKVVLSGIFFDHDKAIVKPKSKDSLNIISQYLKKHVKEKVFVVGHTDSNGNYDHNLTLSKQRADAVVQALYKGYKIPLARLKAIGVGPVSPAAGNGNKQGRQENRRVELVLQ